MLIEFDRSKCKLIEVGRHLKKLIQVNWSWYKGITVDRVSLKFTEVEKGW